MLRAGAALGGAICRGSGPQESSEFRRRLEGMAGDWRVADSPEKMHSVESSFCGELREYQDRATARLARLRHDLEAGAKAMEAFAESIAANGEDHEQEIAGEMGRLERLAETASLEKIRRGIHHASAEVAASLERIRRSNQMVIAQLKDEIRLLHEEVQTRKRSLAADADSGACNREQMDKKIEELLRLNRPFCTLFVNIRNLRRAEARNSPSVVEGALKTLVRRIYSVVGEEAVVGRWSIENFVATLDPQSGGSMELIREITRKLSDSYVVKENGLSHDVTLEVTAGTVDHAADRDAAAFRKKLVQLSAALEG